MQSPRATEIKMAGNYSSVKNSEVLEHQIQTKRKPLLFFLLFPPLFPLSPLRGPPNYFRQLFPLSRPLIVYFLTHFHAFAWFGITKQDALFEGHNIFFGYNRKGQSTVIEQSTNEENTPIFSTASFESFSPCIPTETGKGPTEKKMK